MSIQSFTELPLPMALKSALPHSTAAGTLVAETRTAIERMVHGEDKRLLMIVGPCSIHNEDAALEYAQNLTKLRVECKSEMEIVMRTYFEKPRTVDGWPGFIQDPHLTGQPDYAIGVQKARQLLLAINDLGLPCATEVLDPIVYQYIDDLISWGTIGARTAESQTHRKIASGLLMPIGFKNNTHGDVDIAINAMKAARTPKTFIGIADNGTVGQVTTTGNQYTHVVLRGGDTGPNYDYKSIMDTAEALQVDLLPNRVLVDVSHANSGKDHTKQPGICQEILDAYIQKHAPVLGMMVESNLGAGKQPYNPANPENMKKEVSITDPCLGWTETEVLIRQMFDVLKNRVSG